MHIGFYAPLKPPDHPTPSGDRRMARLLMTALQAAGHTVSIASTFRSYDGAGDPQRQTGLRQAGEAVAQDLIDAWSNRGAGRPDLWFTYHVYYKAPDWLGPTVSRALGLPYAVAEASYAPKRAGGPWDLGHRATADAIAAADTVFCLTQLDIECVRPLVPADHRLVHLPPFIDAAPFADAARDRPGLARRLGLDPDAHWLLAIGMMRPGDKLESYRALAAALALVTRDDWRLLIVGDGPARAEVETAFADLHDRVCFIGELPPDQVPCVCAAADLYVWPGVGEAYGMAYLEAQAAGLPVVAGAERGVPDVVADGRTGLLCPPGDAGAMARAVDHLLADASRRQALATAARRFAGEDRALANAARILRDGLA